MASPLGLAACGATPTAQPTVETQPAAAVQKGAEPTPGLSTETGSSQPREEDTPAIDVVSATLTLTDTGALDPFLGGLRLWNGSGQPLSAGQVLSATLVEQGEEGATQARWQVALSQSVTASLSVAAHQVSPGILSVVVTATQAPGITGVGVCLPAGPGEHFYGLGERFGHLDLRGQVVRNRTAEEAGLRTTYAPSTFLLSSRGYGLYLETMLHATFDLRIGERGCYLVRDEGAGLHVYLFAGPDPADAVRRHSRWIGLPPLPPEWSVGVWKNLIGGQQRVLNDLDRLDEAGVPLDAVWIYDAVVERDGFGWPWQIYGPIAPGSYPDVPGLVDQLHGRGLKVLGYLNPFVYPGWAGYQEAARNNYLVRTQDGQVYLQNWTFGRRAYVDFSNPEATRWWQSRVQHALGQVGFDGAMLDFGEDAPHEARYAGAMQGHSMDNMYPVLYHRAAFEAGQAVRPGNFVFFARSGYSGSQPYTTGRFTGDQVRNWDQELGLPSVIPAVINGSLSGWPYWAPDIAGFFQGPRAVEGPGEKELWIRWLELGALMPTMRDIYGAMDGDPVDIWTDDETLSLFRTYARLHTALKPYLYRYARIAHKEGMPIVRPLFLNHPGEAETYDLDDQYLLGDDVLVAPVLEPGQVERLVYLPAGRWQDYWTGEMHEGPGRVTVPAPLHQIPIFLRDGTDLDLPSP